MCVGLKRKEIDFAPLFDFWSAGISSSRSLRKFSKTKKPAETARGFGCSVITNAQVKTTTCADPRQRVKLTRNATPNI